MNGVPIKSIKGALVAKKDLLRIVTDTDMHHTPEIIAQELHTKQGEISITLNRERLAKELWLYDWDEMDRCWETEEEYMQDNYRKRADAIITNLNDLIEVIK